MTDVHRCYNNLLTDIKIFCKLGPWLLQFAKTYFNEF